MSRTIRIAAVFFGLLKLGIALVLPVFGDEAYYVYWGSSFSGGYYDLPPMIGWWLWPLLKVSAHPLWLRLFNLLAPVLIALGLYEWLRESIGGEKARNAALLFLLLPLPFLSVISFPDVPLMFFSFFSALLFYRGVKRQASGISLDLLLAGSLWGAAFLSKYFAVFLLPAFLIWAWPRARSPWAGVASFTLGAAPFLLQHVLWNSRHCWANFMFNLVSRQRVDEGSVLRTTGGFLLNLAAVSLPLLVSAAVSRGPGFGGLTRFFALLLGTPLMIFLVTALLGRAQGFHWLLFLTPFAAAWSALRLREERLLRAVRVSAVMAGALGLAMLVVFAFPSRLLPAPVRERNPFDFSIAAYPEEFQATIAPRIRDAERIFTESYSRSSVLNHLRLRYGGIPQAGVWMSGSRFGRTFDWRVDWGALEGKTIAFLKPGAINGSLYSPYFASHEVLSEESEGAGFQILLGRGFRARDFWRERVRPELEGFYPAGPGAGCPIVETPEAGPDAR